MDDLISIIVPVYNSQDYLCECVESICGQTYKNLQIILVDDCSTDNSGKICDDFANQDSRVEVFRPDKNGGQSAARNLGLKHAKGQGIAFADNDDTLEPTMLETLLRGAIKHNVKVSGCANKRIEDGQVKICDLDGRKSGIMDTAKLVEDILINPKDTGIEVGTKLYHASLINKLNFPVGCQLEDYKVNLPLFYEIEKVYFDNRPLYNGHIRKSSQSKQRFFNNRISYFDVSGDIRRGFEEKKAPQNIISAAYVGELGVKSSLLVDMCSTDIKELRIRAKDLLPQVKSLYPSAKKCERFMLKSKIHIKLRFFKVQIS